MVEPVINSCELIDPVVVESVISEPVVLMTGTLITTVPKLSLVAGPIVTVVGPVPNPTDSVIVV